LIFGGKGKAEISGRADYHSGKIFVFAGANLNKEKGKKKRKRKGKEKEKEKKRKKREKPPFLMSLHLLRASFDAALLLNCH
jgi:hypothetical protein